MVMTDRKPEQGHMARGLRRLRWRLRRVWARAHFGGERMARSPLLFANSFPKSGTHLLIQVLEAFPRIGPGVIQGMGPVLTFERETGRKRSGQEIARELEPLGPGDIGFGHVIATTETLAILCRSQVAHFFLYRDPRDVVVSHAFYVTDKADDHVHHAYYTDALSSAEDRIETSILGRPGSGLDFPDIGERFALYRGWLECPWVCRLRYEDFITDRAETLRSILAYAQERGFTLHKEIEPAVKILAEAIDPQRSPTFRRGKIGGWKDHFNDRHKGLFKEVAGDLLIQLGYEQDKDW
jgi:hypothetical protein